MILQVCPRPSANPDTHYAHVLSNLWFVKKMVGVIKELIWIGFVVWENACILLASFLPCLKWGNPLPFLQSTRAANWAAMKTLCSPSVPAAVTTGRLQFDGVRMRCPQDLLCGHILFNQLARFLVPQQKVFVMAYSSTVLLPSVSNTTVNSIMNTNISFLLLRANRLIFMMHILSINQFILWKENFNVQYFCWFYVFYCRCA